MNDPIEQEPRYGANAQQRKLVSCVPADVEMMQQNRALRKVDKYTKFPKEIEEFTADWQRGGKIQNRRPNETAQKMELPDLIAGKIGKVNKGSGRNSKTDGIDKGRQFFPF